MAGQLFRFLKAQNLLAPGRKAVPERVPTDPTKAGFFRHRPNVVRQHGFGPNGTLSIGRRAGEAPIPFSRVGRRLPPGGQGCPQFFRKADFRPRGLRLQLRNAPGDKSLAEGHHAALWRASWNLQPATSLSIHSSQRKSFDDSRDFAPWVPRRLLMTNSSP